MLEPEPHSDTIAQTPVAMSIASGDSSCGAGVQADLLSFAACKVYGLSAFAALTAQNPNSVRAIVELKPDFLLAQLEHNDQYYNIGAVKTGMLFSAPLIELVADFLADKTYPLVVDPVMVATSGARLLKEDAIATLVEQLLPKAKLITPNLDEAAVLLGKKPESPEALRASAKELAERFQTAVLLKGGHLQSETLLDVLVEPEGTLHEFQATRKADVNTHGSGCTLSAAIAAELAKGQSLSEATRTAHAYLQRGFAQALQLGSERFIAHSS